LTASQFTPKDAQASTPRAPRPRRSDPEVQRGFPRVLPAGPLRLPPRRLERAGAAMDRWTARLRVSSPEGGTMDTCRDRIAGAVEREIEVLRRLRPALEARIDRAATILVTHLSSPGRAS
jgi:hypothetical protein